MNEISAPLVPRKRTAVLVVHGMGSQRPLDTVRGVVEAVWLESDHGAKAQRRIWTHPERSGVDIDLPVITTSFVAGTDHRRIDFHELYWAHLMSETRAVAVLLWLCELARKGPRLKPAISALYWGALIFLNLLVLSVSLLAIQFVVHFLTWIADIRGDLHSLILVLALVLTVVSGAVFLFAIVQKAFRVAAYAAVILVAASAGLLLADMFEPIAELLTVLLLPTLVAGVVIAFTMGGWGLAGLVVVLALSAVGLVAGLVLFRASWSFEAFPLEWIPWSTSSLWSSEAAWLMIALYLVLYAAFLQPYLGDAARDFRDSPANVAVRREIRKQAVDTLEALHLSGDYDRIIVVAHSLGTVIAYDMLRAYYSRIDRSLPDPSVLGSDFAAVDDGTLSTPAARAKGRDVIRHIAQAVEAAQQRIKAGRPEPGDKELKAWLVTDFVTMGSPLTHAYYLMCRGNTEGELRADFERRTREREFPTSPPLMLDNDRRRTFLDPNTRARHFHHGGQFALTRWTNLYFPVSQLLWGDAIGGPVGAIFGDPKLGSNIADIKVYTNTAERDHFFAHVLYWNGTIPPDGYRAPHIEALRRAVDIADAGLADELGSPAAKI
jgi:hypothetical protein